MDPSTWESLHELFFAALELPAPERAALLARARETRPQLVADVEALLAAHETGEGMQIESSLLRDGEPDEASLAGKRAGPWRLVRRLGHGGMGEVWLAERADGEFQQKAAIKRVRSGWRPADLVARFRRERQLLASLAHPNIAKLLDGGTTAEGEPYLAMEYVEGESLTAWCDQRRLGVRERLRVFAQVCEAVRFAHANLVVHRDLKPANILVTAEGRPVLLDFGIAKLLQREDDGEQTLAGERMLTPEYAAPEQLRGESVTTATDVWGLGVLLYELLTGERPFRTSGAPTAEIERRVLGSDPRRMGDVARTGEKAGLDTAAARRDTTAAGLSSQLEGDLEAIVQFALRKEPERRYRSAEQFGEDIERYLAGRPVLARPDTFGYRAAKYVRRHRAGVAAVAALALSLVAFGVVATLQARRIAAERDRARAEEAKSARVLDVLVDLFKLSDPRTVPGGDTLRIGDVLRIAEGKVGDVEDQPEVQARLWEALASIHQSRSELQEQRASLEHGLAAAQLAGDADLALRLKRAQAQLITRLEGQHAADSLLRANLAESEARYGPHDARVAAALDDLAGIAVTGPERLAMIERALAIRRAISPQGSVDVASSLNMLSGWWADHNQPARALQLLQQSLDMLQPRLPAEHPDVLLVRHNMAMTLAQLGRFEEARRMDAEMLPVRRRVLGLRTTAVAANLTGIGYALVQLGRYGEAADTLAEAVDLLGSTVGAQGHAALGVERTMTYALARAGRRDEALAHLASVLAHGAATPGGPSAEVWLLRMRLAGLDQAAGSSADLAFLRDALAHVRASRMGSARTRLDAIAELGSAALAGGEVAAAESLFAESAAMAETTLAAEHPARAYVHAGLLAAHAAAGRAADRAALRASWERCRTWGYVPPAFAAAIERTLASR